MRPRSRSGVTAWRRLIWFTPWSPMPKPSTRSCTRRDGETSRREGDEQRCGTEEGDGHLHRSPEAVAPRCGRCHERREHEADVAARESDSDRSCRCASLAHEIHEEDREQCAAEDVRGRRRESDARRQTLFTKRPLRAARRTERRRDRRVARRAGKARERCRPTRTATADA